MKAASRLSMPVGSAKSPRGRAALAAALVVSGCALSFLVLTSGLAGYFEARGDAEGALRWRSQSPTAKVLSAEALAARQNYPAATAAAKQALSRSPLEARAMVALALTTAADQTPGAALPLMQRASDMNRRGGIAHTWLFNTAMARGEYSAAFLHADALLRRSNEGQGSIFWVLLGAMGTSEAREALAQRLGGDPPWRAPFFQAAGHYGSVDWVGALYEAVATTKSPPSDVELTAYFLNLTSQRRYQEVEYYWNRLLPPRMGKRDLVFDGGFESLRGPPPVNWQVVPVKGGSATMLDERGAPMGYLRLRHDGFSSSGWMIRQLLFLKPGAYVISARAGVDEPSANGRFRLEITCAPGPRLVALTLGGQPGKVVGAEARFSVDPDSCPAQWLTARPNSSDRRDPVDMRLEEIEIHRVADNEDGPQAP